MSLKAALVGITHGDKDGKNKVTELILPGGKPHELLAEYRKFHADGAGGHSKYSEVLYFETPQRRAVFRSPEAQEKHVATRKAEHAASQKQVQEDALVQSRGRRVREWLALAQKAIDAREKQPEIPVDLRAKDGSLGFDTNGAVVKPAEAPPELTEDEKKNRGGAKTPPAKPIKNLPPTLSKDGKPWKPDYVQPGLPKDEDGNDGEYFGSSDTSKLLFKEGGKWIEVNLPKD